MADSGYFSSLSAQWDAIAAWSVRRPEELSAAAEVLLERGNELDDIAVRVAGVIDPYEWTGIASDAALTSVLAATTEVRALAQQWTNASRDLRSAADDGYRLASRPGTAQDVQEVIELDRWLEGRLRTLTEPGLGARVDRTNRERLLAERRQLERVERELRDELMHNRFGGLFSNADAGLAQTSKRLAALDAIDDVLALGNRQLLVLDNSGERETKAVVGIGDVDNADRIAVFVPGLGSTVQGDLARYDADLERVVADAGAVVPGSTVAGITWLGYEAPQMGWGLIDPDSTVLGVGAARIGGAELADFLNTLDGSKVTVIGHSYGSLTAAEALTGGAHVDDYIALGSPGLGVSGAAELGAQSVYVVESPTDPVADAGWFGRDANLLPGAKVLRSDGAFGHSSYLDAGTLSEVNVAAVVAGVRPPAPAPIPFDVGDVVRQMLGSLL